MVGFVNDGNVSYAGRHLLIDFYNCKNHGSIDEIEEIMKKSCLATGATILYSYLHPFTGGGVSGAIILAESHQSIHTWPENDFVCLDMFVCGECDPNNALPILTNYFKPERIETKLQFRGNQI